MKPIYIHKKLRSLIAIGYCLVIALTCIIVYIYQHEQNQFNKLEKESNYLHIMQQKIHDAYASLLELTMFGETILEWDKGDTATYRNMRMKVDGLLRDFKIYYSGERIDSVRRILAEKEMHLFEISHLYDEQMELHTEMTKLVPVIANETIQEQKKKKGFFGLFQKKEQSRSAITTKLYSLNREVIKKQSEHVRKLSETADSLASRNIRLNEQLQALIKAMDERIQIDLQQREESIKESRKHSTTIIGGLTVFIFILLVVSYFIIHRNVSRIIIYRKEMARLIEKEKRINQEKSELLNDRENMMLTVSHDLRAPLTVIKGYAEMLADEKKKINRQKYVDTILESSEQMLSLLNTLLSYYRLDAGKEQSENAPFKLKALVDILDSEFSPLAENKGLTFVGGHHGDDVVVMGDRKRIIQIANNLLSNAIKFTSDGYVILQVDYMDGNLTISVSDSGKGMSEEQIKRMYQPFERFGDTSEQEGFGLGLPITLGLVNMLGGTIDVKSDIGKGCIFTVRLPLSVCTDEILLQQSVAPIELSPNLRIAVVDNDAFVLRMTTRMLASCKVKADGCSNAGELMERMRTIKYDLVITDIMMPQINGYELLELLRNANNENARNVPVLAITGRAELTSEDFKVRGFVGCIHKPFSKDELLSAINECIDNNLMSEIEIDFSTLLTGEHDDTEMLELLIKETDLNMQLLDKAIKDNDKEGLSAAIHHLLSSWELLGVGYSVKELQNVVKKTSSMDGDVVKAFEQMKNVSIQLTEQARAQITEDKP